MEASKGTHPIPWLRPDLSKPAPPLGLEYGKALVHRIKELLIKLESDGKMNDEKISWYWSDGIPSKRILFFCQRWMATLKHDAREQVPT